jgi:enamine deaminase RidA (YjgF/YER057c/UK114 family)
MHSTSRLIAIAVVAGLSLSPAVRAQEVERLPGNPASPLVPAVMVPPGYNTYYISGATAAVANAGAPKGSFESYGDMATQTRSVLDNLKGTLTKLGLTFGDVVQAHVYMTPDPSQNGGIDFAAMNKVWLTEFGTAAQPHKPARAAVKVASLAGPGLLVEIEFTAVKKAAAK